MIGISKLYCGTIEASDVLRYGAHSARLPSHLLQFSADKKPVVVWNCTRRCNLACKHCYATATGQGEEELTTQQGEHLIDDLADFGVPVLLLSGGEPLARRDVAHLAAYAVGKGMRVVISTNGTLLDADTASRLHDVGLSYVGISLDGHRQTNDLFRGRTGAFDEAIAGVRNCLKIGLKVGLRFTINRHNAKDVPFVFQLLRQEGIPRACFYHLAYSGRGAEIINDDLDHDATRKIVDLIIDETARLHHDGVPVEVLTVDNHADGAYLYLRMLREQNPRAEKVLELLKMNGGNSSGNGIGCVSWDGSVHPDQFWRSAVLGNVGERPFSQIWTDLSNPLLAKLKDKCPHLTGRCTRCRFIDICGGNLRARSEAATGNAWSPDPACYLTEEEIAGE